VTEEEKKGRPSDWIERGIRGQDQDPYRRGLATDRRKVRTVSATIRRNGANQFQSSGKGEREGESATLAGKRE